jgi:hypothetical protein
MARIMKCLGISWNFFDFSASADTRKRTVMALTVGARRDSSICRNCLNNLRHIESATVLQNKS